MTSLPSVVCRARESAVGVSTSRSFSTTTGSLSIGGLPNYCSCMGVSSESIWHDKWSDEGRKLNKKQEFKEDTLATSGGEMEGLTSSSVLEALVISTKIGSFWGSADEGSVDADLNAWDNSSAPRANWDAMVDNYEERGLKVGYHFEEKMNCFTWVADGLVLRSLFPVTVFWVVPWAALHFEDWYVTEAAWVFISFFSGGAVNPILEAGHGGW